MAMNEPSIILAFLVFSVVTVSVIWNSGIKESQAKTTQQFCYLCKGEEICLQR